MNDFFCLSSDDVSVEDDNNDGAYVFVINFVWESGHQLL